MSEYGNLQKYQNPNPIQRWLIERFLNVASDLVAGLPTERVLDAGSGEGFVSNALISHGWSGQVIAVDCDFGALKRGQEEHTTLAFCQGDVYTLPFATCTFDLVICTEVLEHLHDPESALRELCRVARRYCLLSVPHEPFFRLSNFVRGKHIQRWGNDPEHLHNWNDKAFRRLVVRHLEILEVRRPFPWLVALARTKSR